MRSVKNLMHVNNLMLALEKCRMRPLHDPILWLFTLLLVAVVVDADAIALAAAT